MTMIKLVQQALRQGIQVKYRQRTDGGIVVQEIAGTKYQGNTAGNAALRSMMGAQLSTKKQKQLIAAQQKTGKTKIREVLTATEKYLSQKIAKQQKVNQKEKPLSLSKARKLKDKYGINFERTLRNKLRIVQGKAQIESIQWLFGHLAGEEVDFINKASEYYIQYELRDGDFTIKSQWSDEYKAFRKDILKNPTTLSGLLLFLKEKTNSVSEEFVTKVLGLIYEYRNGQMTQQELFDAVNELADIYNYKITA